MPGDDITNYRLDLIEKAVKDIGLSLTAIQQTLQTLATLEVRHTETREALQRAFASIEKLDARMDGVERTLPVLKLTSNWVKAAVLGVLSLVAAGLWKLLVP